LVILLRAPIDLCPLLLAAAIAATTAATAAATAPGRAVQVHPIKPTLKPTGTKRLKLKCDVLLSTSAFNLNVCRYNQEQLMAQQQQLQQQQQEQVRNPST
jgi:hypothetical protein